MSTYKKVDVIEEAQAKLDWAIKSLDGKCNCKVDDYKDEKYLVRFFVKRNEFIKAINIPEEWVEDTNPNENYIRGELRSLLNKLEKEAPKGVGASKTYCNKANNKKVAMKSYRSY